MRILAIETSCDETGIAIVKGTIINDSYNFVIESAVLYSQAKLHAAYGGVYPTLAKREHEKNLPILLEEVLKKNKSSEKTEIDAIAVTVGPGLEPALWCGIEFAKHLSSLWDKPLFSVNHMEGHLISSLVENSSIQAIDFPVLALLISGGHSEFICMNEWFTYEVIGETLDDAVGEAFDKVARMLSLPYPGGPHISKLANEARALGLCSEIVLPRPMLLHKTTDMSFSGLKTAALYAIQSKGGIEKFSNQEIQSFAREFEDAVTEVFISKTKRALIETEALTFVIGGGVAANEHIRSSLTSFISTEFPNVTLRLPQLTITGDNAIMIAEAALMHLLANDWLLSNPPPLVDIKASGNLSIALSK